MASINRTLSFADDDNLSARRIHDLLDTLTVTGIQRGDAASDTSFLTISASAPSSPKQGEEWVNTLPASGQIVGEMYDGTLFRPRTVAFLAKNTSGSTIPEGSILNIDPANANATTDLSVPVVPVAVRDSYVFGVNLTELTTSGASQLGPAIQAGKVVTIRKNSADSWVIGNFLVPSATPGVPVAQNAGGQSAFAVVVRDAGVGTTTGQAFVFGSNPCSYGVFRTVGAVLYDGVVPTVGVWSGRMATPTFFTYPVDQAATKAHDIELQLTYTGTPNDTDHALAVFIRSRDDAAGATFPSLYPMTTGRVRGHTAPKLSDIMVKRLLVPHAISGGATQAEFFITGSIPTLSNLNLRVVDRGHWTGGAVL